MNRSKATKTLAVFTALIGFTFAFSPSPVMATLTKTDSLDEIQQAYEEKRIELTSSKAMVEDQDIVHQIIEEVGETIDENTSPEHWPIRFQGKRSLPSVEMTPTFSIFGCF